MSKCRALGRGSFGSMLAVSLCVCAVLSSRATAQRMHQVKPGQTFAAIARSHHVSVWDLALANDLQPDGKLRAGQTLIVPPSGVTYVRPGQTLSQIARAHDCSVDTLQRLNGLRGSTSLRAGSRIRLPGFMPEKDADAAVDRDWGAPERPGFVTLLGRAGDPVVELVDRDGKVRLKGLRALAEQMRRQATDPPQSVHPRLAVLLSKISDHFGGRPLRVVSGFRETGGYTREGSRHTQGRAADIQVEGVSRRAVWEYCRSLAQTGCGFYPHSVFVHVDVREHHAQWVDWSTPGARPRYGTLTRPYRRRERTRADRPRLGRNVTRADDVPLVVEVVNRYNAVVRIADERVVGEQATDEPAQATIDEVGEPSAM